MDPFAALTLDWQAISGRQPARRAIAAWAEAAPVLAGFATPAELIHEINRAGRPARSCALLAELGVLARSARLAGRAVLQAVMPGIRHATSVRWRKAATAGPWRNFDEIAGDAISAAWSAIHAHAGQHHPRPAQLIIRHVEGALRRTHGRWISETAVRNPLYDTGGDPSETHVVAQSPEEQAPTVIGEAVRSEAIDPLGTAVLTMTGVLGYSISEVARTLELPYPTVDPRLRRARRTMLALLPLRGGRQGRKSPGRTHDLVDLRR